MGRGVGGATTDLDVGRIASADGQNTAADGIEAGTLEAGGSLADAVNPEVGTALGGSVLVLDVVATACADGAVVSRCTNIVVTRCNGSIEGVVDVASRGAGYADGDLVATAAGRQLARCLGIEGIRHRRQLESGGHLTVPGGGTGAANVHGEVELLIPRHVAGEAGDITQVDGEIAIGDSDLVGAGAGLCPKQGAASGGIVELEFDVVVPIGGNGTRSTFQAGLEVQVVARGSIRGRRRARKEKQR